MAAKFAWPEVSVMETLATRVLIVHLTWSSPHLSLPVLGLCSHTQPISKGLYHHAFESGLLQADISSSLLLDF